MGKFRDGLERIELRRWRIGIERIQKQINNDLKLVDELLCRLER